MSDHTPCIRLNQSNWTVDGAGEPTDGFTTVCGSILGGMTTLYRPPVDCDERSGHPDDEEVLDDEYELPNIDVYDILGGAAPIIGKYFSVFVGGDEGAHTRIVQGLVLAARIYRDMKELVEKDDKKGVEELVSVVFTKIFDLARAEYVSKETKKEEERKAHEEGLKYREDRCKIVEGQIAARKEEQKEEYRQVVRETVEEVLRQQLASMKTSPVTDLY